MICTRIETGTNRCERCGDSPTTGFFCTDIPAELHTEKFTASDALLCAVCAGEQDPEHVEGRCMMADNFDGIVLDRDGNINNDVEGGDGFDFSTTAYPYIPSRLVRLADGEAQDVLYMLEDYIMNMEDRLECYGENAIELDDGLQVDQANLACACNLHDKIKAVFGKEEVTS